MGAWRCRGTLNTAQDQCTGNLPTWTVSNDDNDDEEMANVSCKYFSCVFNVETDSRLIHYQSRKTYLVCLI